MESESLVVGKVRCWVKVSQSVSRWLRVSRWVRVLKNSLLRVSHWLTEECLRMRRWLRVSHKLRVNVSCWQKSRESLIPGIREEKF